MSAEGSVTLEQVFEVVKTLSHELHDHMEREEETVEEFRKELHGVSLIMQALPVDDLGKTDFYGHRRDHETYRSGTRELGRVKAHLRNKVFDILLYVGLYLIVSGRGSEILKSALEMMK